MTPTTIAAVLPPFIIGRERRTDADVGSLHPDEMVAIARAVPGRRLEFTTVRTCAREALAALGSEASPWLAHSLGSASVVPGAHGAPTWPIGVVGSMTHCEGYRAAAVGWSTSCRSVGIDAERHLALPADAVDVVMSRGERAHVRRLTVLEPAVHWGRVLFSIKESIYKSWFPIMQCWLGFDDVEVDIDPEHGSFVGRLRDGHPATRSGLAEWRGRFVVDSQLILTSVVVPSDGAADGSRAAASS